MKKPNFLKKFTKIDFLIIIVFILVVGFAFIHISSDNQDTTEKTSYDSSTLNKIPLNYFNYYREGKVIRTTVNGYNASSSEEIELNGIIKWVDDDRGGNVKILIESNGKNYLATLYNVAPNTDIYIKKISLETSGETYKNLTEIKTSPKKINSFNDFVKGFENKSNYEISTLISVNPQDTLKYQEISNILYNTNKRISIKPTNTGLSDQIILIQATSTELNQADIVFGNIEGLTNEITIRIYNCTPEDIDLIKSNYNITHIRKF